MTQDEPGNAFVANPGRRERRRHTDIAIGTQAAVVTTDGIGTTRSLARIACRPSTSPARRSQLWLKVDNVDAPRRARGPARRLEPRERVRVRSAQRPEPPVDQRRRLGLGRDPVAADADRRHAEPRAHHRRDGPRRRRPRGPGQAAPQRASRSSPRPRRTIPDGVVHVHVRRRLRASSRQVAAPILAAHQFPATAYIIVDQIDKAGRATLADLHSARRRRLGHRCPRLHAGRPRAQLHRALARRGRGRHGQHARVADRERLHRLRSLRVPERRVQPRRARRSPARTSRAAGRSTPASRSCSRRRTRAACASATSRARSRSRSRSSTSSEARQNHEWLILVFHKLVAGTPAASTEWRTIGLPGARRSGRGVGPARCATVTQRLRYG